jgi:hypothetical protein
VGICPSSSHQDSFDICVVIEILSEGRFHG